jgi:hypothetical protein
MATYSSNGETFNPRADPKGTKSGDVYIYPGTSAGGFDASLFDFDIDDFKLKSNHTAWLDKTVSAIKSTPAASWDIYIDAFASKTGSANHNRILTQLREQAAEDYLRGKLPEGAGFKPVVNYVKSDWQGFDKTTVAGEDKAWRSVRVAIVKKGLPTPKPKPLPPPTSKVLVSSNFQIRFEGSASPGYTSPYGISIGVDTIIFRIWDKMNLQAAVFYYTAFAVGLAIPWSKIPPVSTTLPSGDWETILTTRDIELRQFEGTALFQTTGWLSVSANVLYIQSLPDGVKTYPNPVPISTGTSPVPSSSNSVGRLTLAFGPFAFTG